MGFLRRLFGNKKPVSQSDGSGSKPGKESKRRWSFGKNSNKDKSLTQPQPPPSSSAVNHLYDSSSSLDANKHAIAVAAATAAVAEAALAAAHAAAEVVRLTSTTGGGSSSSSRPDGDAVAHVGLRRWQNETAAVKIQSAFRGYLARRALRALKALVKLQALVRGHIVRKQTADMLRRMQTLVRLQSQARASRAHLSADHTNLHPFKSSLSHYPVPEEYEHPLRAYSTKFDGSSILKRCSSNANFRNSDWERVKFGSNWLESWMEENVHNQTRDATMRNNGHNTNIIDDDKSDKILEVDTWKPNFRPHHYSSSSTSTFQKSHYYFNSDYNNNNNDNSFMPYESPSKRSSSREVLQLSSLKLHKGKEEAVSSSRTADNSPQPFSSSSSRQGIRKGPFTPTRSECSWGFFNGYVGHPNYMANTESSRAKVRSMSAPRQRLDYDRYGSTRRSTIQGLWDVVGPNNNSDRDYCDLRNKAYPPLSRFNRIGSSNLR